MLHIILCLTVLHKYGLLTPLLWCDSICWSFGLLFRLAQAIYTRAPSAKGPVRPQ